MYQLFLDKNTSPIVFVWRARRFEIQLQINNVFDESYYARVRADGIDPAYPPGTGTPEVGGYTVFEAQQMVRGLKGLTLIGADVVEVSPPFDPSGNTALVGATIMFEILCNLAH